MTTDLIEVEGMPTRAGRRGRRRRERIVTLALLAVVFVLFVVTLMVGSFRLSPGEVLGSLLGFSDDGSVNFVVRDLRLPTAVTAVFVGLAFGLSGIIFQRLLSNPLASPDFVGISQGASLAAIWTIILTTWSAVVVAGFAVLGALTAALVIYLLAWRGGVTGYRFILVGIGVAQFCVAMIGYVISRAQLFDAREAMTWLVGSVGQAGSTQLRILVVVVAVLLPLAMLMAHRLAALELGDPIAIALGVGVERTRLALLAIAVLLIAVGVAAAGPISFVALVSGPIATRLVRTGGSLLLPAALVGAVLVLASDLVAQHVVPVSLPTGVVTGAVGAPYMIWLLATVNREGRGG